MSRVGLKPIEIPEGVTATLVAGSLSLKGPLGELTIAIPSKIKVEIQDKIIRVSRESEVKFIKSLHGLTRAQIANAILGVSKGFEKRLEITGVGYRAEASGEGVRLYLGFSHPVDYMPEPGVKIALEKNQIIVTGSDKQKVGQVSAEIRNLRPPEPYKGKGIKYLGEVVYLKPGKAVKAIGAPGGAAPIS